MNDRHVLDSSAVLVLLGNEEGAEVVDSILSSAVISTVNFAEVISKLQERGGADETIDAALADLNLAVISFDNVQADKAGKLRKVTRSRGLSLGDRACLALADQLNAVAVTTDQAWSDLTGIARLLLVR
jgi:ribonuclease VapC